MQIQSLDPVNIVTHDLEKTANFYATLLGLEKRESPGTAMGFKGHWMYDASGDPIVHLVELNPAQDFGRGHEPGAITGAVHHVAFKCSGFDDAIRKLEAIGAEFRSNKIASIGLRQIFVPDPNNVMLELNFLGD